MSHHSTAAPAPSHVKKDLGVVVKSFTPIATADPVNITDVKPVASYSWINATTPTIIVPGSPPVWTNANPKRVPADSGLVFIDQNSYRMGRIGSPLTPIFAAIDDLGPYDFSALDLVSDRNNLRKLFRWATGVANEKDFRIDIDLAGQTCLFTRIEEKDSETVVGFKGFGQEYKKAATRLSQGYKKATSHHRIISINLDGLHILLRFEVDACTGPENIDIDDLTSALSGLAIKRKQATSATVEESPAPGRSAIPGISIIHTPSCAPVPQSSLIELKTRATHRPLDWSDAYPQLYLSQTAYLFLAKHNRGTFVEVEKVVLTGSLAMKAHAKQAEAGMVRLKAVLTEVLSAVRNEGSGVGLSLVQQAGNLVLYRRKEGTGKSIGKEILSRFV